MTTLNTTTEEVPQQTLAVKAPQPSKGTFPFLDLPAELRIQIYNLALPSKVRVRPLSSFAWSVTEYKDALALQRTCHQIRNEGRPLLFNNSTFDIELYDQHGMEHFRKWADGAGDELVSRIKHFGIGAAIGTSLFKAEVRVDEAGGGAVVACSGVGAHVLCRSKMFEQLASARSTIPPTCRRQRAVFNFLNELNREEWIGYFSVADMKTTVCEIGRGIELHNAGMADREKEGFWAW